MWEVTSRHDTRIREPETSGIALRKRMLGGLVCNLQSMGVSRSHLESVVEIDASFEPMEPDVNSFPQFLKAIESWIPT